MIQNIKIIYQDNALLVLDKPAYILVHPTMAKEKNTLADFIKKNFPQINRFVWPDPNRAGIVHRLDKDTSGLIIIAKKPDVLINLQSQFKRRIVKKNYLALVLGKIKNNRGLIETQITRGKNGLQKAVGANYSFIKSKTKPAITEYETIGEYQYQNQTLSLVKASPQTGRMHQIRLHLKYIGHPIIGDPLYNNKLSRQVSNKLKVKRQFLHAEQITFNHPYNHHTLSLNSKLPEELQKVLFQIKPC